MEKIQYKIEVFEGPMDLLLQLISKKQVSINDVPILEIIEQYLDYVKALQEDNLDIASEFLEMAARLIYIKTVSLLPVQEEAEQLVEELRGELIEYRDCKLVAGKLRNSMDGFDYMYREPEEIEADLMVARQKKVAINTSKLEADNIYKTLMYFDTLYSKMNDEEKHNLLSILISEINIYEDKQPNGQWLKEIEFSLPIIGSERLYMSLDNGNSVETVVLLSKA